MSLLVNDDYYNIIKKRDPKFDGRFYYGVITTGIYCRPICPARPKQENIELYRSSAEAESKGYRPCKRCRPDQFSEAKLISNGKEIINRALEIIDLNQNDINTEDLANYVGITSRHLRRVFNEELGANPVDVINTKRLHVARLLLNNSKNKITEIAFASGFKSLRRFNEVFKQVYNESPSSFRTHPNELKSEPNCLEFKLPYRGTYDWDYTLKYLKKHIIFGKEKIENNIYTRYVPRADNDIGVIIVNHSKKQKQLFVKVYNIPIRDFTYYRNRINRLFDLGHNPYLYENQKLLEGIRVLGAFEPYEVAVSIILGQLISTSQATKKLEQLVTKYGEEVTSGCSKGQRTIIFPSPQKMMNKRIESIGITKTKANAIRSLSKLINSGEISFEHPKSPDEIRKSLLKIKGIGSWTSEMIAMRCFNDVDSYPSNDLIVRRAVENCLINVDNWALHRSYLTHYIWRNYAESLNAKNK